MGRCSERNWGCGVACLVVAMCLHACDTQTSGPPARTPGVSCLPSARAGSVPPSAMPADATTQHSEPLESAEEPPDGTGVAAVACDTSWLPAQLVLDVSGDQTEGLVRLVEGWGRGIDSPRLDCARGTVLAEDPDPLTDPPYPSFLQRGSKLACGREALWLHSYVGDLLRSHVLVDGGVRCSKNVCCFAPLAEGDEAGSLVFEPGSRGWVLRAVTLLGEAAMAEDAVRASRTWAAAQIERHGNERCKGEPALVW